MKALIWTGPKTCTWTDAPDPSPKPGWVVLEVRAAGICGSELGAYLGHNELRRPPLIMGHEFTGVAVAVGDGVDRSLLGRSFTVNPLVTCGRCRFCRSGQRQLCLERKIIGVDYPGAFAQYVSVPADALVPSPASMASSLAEPLACAVRAVRQAQVQLGDAVVVFGAGVIGLFCLHLLSRSGAERLAVVDTNAARLEHARMFGATHLVHAGAGDVPSQLRDLFPEGADRAIDAVGLALTRRQGLLCLRRGGRLVFLGLHEDAADLPGNQVVRSEYDVVGSFCYTDGEFQVAVQHLAAGSLPEPTGWLDVRPLHTGDAAFQEQAVGAAPFSKILLTP